MNRRKVVAGVSVCLALGIAAATFMGMMPSGGGMPDMGGMEDTASQKTVVETASPHLGTIAVTGTYVGTAEPGRQVSVYPKASGEVITANFSVGDTVEAGDLLFAIDSTSLQLDIAQTQANLSSSQARNQLTLEQAQNDLDTYDSNLESGYNQTLVNAENAVISAENTVENAEASLQSANASLRAARTAYNDARDDGSDDSTLTSLKNARVQAELQVEQAQLQLEQAEQSLVLAEEALELARVQVDQSRSSSEYSVRSAEISTDLTADQISLQKLQNNLSDYTVYAPISGVIEQKYLDVYDIAGTQSVAYVISNKDAVSISFSVTESTLNNIRLGSTVTVEKDGQTVTGSVSEIATAVDTQSRLYTVKASVANAPFELRTGSTVKVYVDTQTVENEILIPIDAVYYDNGTPYVYRFENNTAVRVEIETGITDQEYIHVKSGLRLSDEIIVTWSANLYDGAEVYLPGTAPVEDADGIELPDGAEFPDDMPEPDPDDMPDTEPEPQAALGEPAEPTGADTDDNTPAGDGEQALPDAAGEEAA